MFDITHNTELSLPSRPRNSVDYEIVLKLCGYMSNMEYYNPIDVKYIIQK